MILKNQIKKKQNNLIQDIHDLDNQIYQETMNISENKGIKTMTPVKKGDSNKLKKNLFEQFNKIQINPHLKVN